MLAASSILKTCCTYGIRTSFKDVSEPHIKKSLVRIASGPVYAADVSFVSVGLLTLTFAIDDSVRSPAGFTAFRADTRMPILGSRANRPSRPRRIMTQLAERQNPL